MAANKTALDAIFKEVYEGGIAEGVNNKNPLRDLITTEQVPFRGREVVLAAHTSRNVSPMFTGEDSTLPDAGRQGYINLKVTPRKLNARIRMTYEVMQDSTSNEGAFISARKSEMQYLIDDIARRDEHAICLDGRGVLAYVAASDPDASAAQAANTVALDSPGGVDGASWGNRYIQVGMPVAFLNPTGPARRPKGNRTVSAVAENGSTITVSPGIGASDFDDVADNDYVVQATNTSASGVTDTSYNRAWNGLMGLVDSSGSYYGVTNRQNYPHLASYEVGASTISEGVLQTASDALDQNLGSRVNVMIMHHSVRRAIMQNVGRVGQASGLTDLRRYSGDATMNPDAGTANFQQGDTTFGGVTLRAIRDFPLGTLVMLDTNMCGFKEFVSESGKWIDEDGQVLRLIGTGTGARDAFEAHYRMRKQYFMECPGANAKLTGISATASTQARTAEALTTPGTGRFTIGSAPPA